MSLLVGQIIASTPQYNPVTIATTLALIGGIIVIGLGLLRLGWIVDFIPNPAIAGFMTGSAITIGLSQCATLFGISGINTRAAGYLVLGTTLAGLGRSKLDAAFGLISLAFLYFIRWLTSYLERRYPGAERVFFFIRISRSIVVVIVSTLIAWGISKGHATPPISILGTVPPGLKVDVPSVDANLLATLAPNIPIVAILMVLEHIAIAQSFGRINDYKINPSQEFVAIGFTNIVASFFQAYPATGSFSRTAIKSKSGVRTPIAGIYSGVVVILAVYLLTPAFFYISNAALAAVIIHAVGDLITGPKTWKQYWRIDPLELFIFIVGVVVTFFVSVEVGIYTTILVSLALFLFRVARPRIEALGRILIVTTSNAGSRYVYVPLDHSSIRTTEELERPPPGIFIFRLVESLTYPNSNYVARQIVDYVRLRTRRGKPRSTKKGDRPWNDTGIDSDANKELPVLKAIILDFTSVSQIDTTGVQALIDIRQSLNRYADQEVEWHFANVAVSYVRRSLVAGGFGGPDTRFGHITEVTPVAPQSEGEIPEVSAEKNDNMNQKEVESGGDGRTVINNTSVIEPYFHFDLDEALSSALH